VQVLHRGALRRGRVGARIYRLRQTQHAPPRYARPPIHPDPSLESPPPPTVVLTGPLPRARGRDMLVPSPPSIPRITSAAHRRPRRPPPPPRTRPSYARPHSSLHPSHHLRRRPPPSSPVPHIRACLQGTLAGDAAASKSVSPAAAAAAAAAAADARRADGRDGTGDSEGRREGGRGEVTRGMGE
jgi:hypothetical protein